MLREEVARFIAVGVSEKVNEERLRSIVDNPKDNYKQVQQFSELSSILDELVRQVGCSNIIYYSWLSDMLAFDEQFGRRKCLFLFAPDI